MTQQQIPATERKGKDAKEMPKPILLVDDETIVRESVKDWLSEDGYQVIAAEDGEQALEMVRKHDFDVGIFDLKLPGKDGIQVLKEAKGQIPALQAVIITAYPSVETATEAMKAGAIDYVTKPFTPDKLERLIEEALKGKPGVAPEVAAKGKETEIGKREEEIAAHLEQGQDYLKKGNSTKAIEEFNNILVMEPGNLEARVWIQKAKTGAIEPMVEGETEEEVAEEVGKPKPCVWMKMGVVAYRLCTSNYDCLTCEFDQQMQQAGESPEVAAALERLKALPGNQRLCRYALRGEVSYRLCSRLFECSTCEFAQAMEDGQEQKLAKLERRREALRKKEAKTKS